MKSIDLTGRRFGRWTVLGRAGRSERGQSLWRCRCDCGGEKGGVLYASLTTGASASCGCLRRELTSERATVHGRSKGREYRAWQQMKVRCYDRSRAEWKHYGGRGIVVCQRWLDGFENFLADMGEAPWGTSIDRVDNGGNYEPGNCRWATRQEQARNTRANRWFEWKGQKRTLTDIARMEGVAYHSFRNMVQAGEEVAQALQRCRDRGLVFRERALFALGPDQSQG